MRQITFVVILISILAPAYACAGERFPQAKAAALEWLHLVDEERYVDSWITSASQFKARISQSEWSSAAHSARFPLGPLVSRTIISRERKASLPEAPDGEYRIFTTKTAFKNKSGATETITLVQKGGQWKVVGYFIR